jgi:ABC-type phosphate transport system auxiliary subunit
MGVSSDSASRWAERTRPWRWPLAGALALSGLVAAGIALHVDSAVCEEAVAGSRKVKLCGPPSLGELALLFVPTLLLLLPDLSEVDVLGFGFKRDLEGTVNEQAQNLGESVEELKESSVGTVAELASGLERLAGNVRDLELTTARDTDVLRETLEALAAIDQRVAELEGQPSGGQN